MAEENENNENENQGISEDELKTIFRTQVKEELDERGVTKEVIEKLNIFDSLEGLFEKHSGSGGVDKDSLLGEIGKLIDDKLKGISTGGGNGGTKERNPKIRIFG